MAIKLSNSSESVKKLHVGIYGVSGIGKTPLAATAPNPIFIDSEDGLTSIADLEIPSIEAKNFEDLEDCIDLLKGKKYKKYETVIIDSFSECSEVEFDELNENAKNEWEAYRELLKKTKKIIREFKKLDKYLIFIFKSREKNDDGSIIYTPSLPGNASTEALPYLLDEVFCLLEDSKGEYKYLLTHPTKKYTAKDRSTKLQKKEKPDMTHIFNKIKQGKTNGETGKKKKSKGK